MEPFEGKGGIVPYDREKAVEYAHKWAYGRNPAYFDFENFGGDCTNFASQCVYAGCGVMNYTRDIGWYYINSYERTASWTGVNFFNNFLISNKGLGPFAEIVDAADAELGDIAQISFADKHIFNHSPVIVQKGNPSRAGNILIAAHTFNTDYYTLTDFDPVYYRYIHIIGVRTQQEK